jgi:outer membrane protein OmpA-like peptidoglycan-associated protein
MGKKDDSAQWISMSDMMTSLMLIFLLIAMAFMYQVQLKQKETNQILGEYNNSKIQIYNDFKKSFDNKKVVWGMEIKKDLSIKFNKDNIEFEPDQSYIKEDFKNILKEFLPKYIFIVNNPIYSKNIKAIKIE